MAPPPPGRPRRPVHADLAEVATRAGYLAEDRFRCDHREVRPDPRRAPPAPARPGDPGIVAEAATVLYEQAYTRTADGTLRSPADRLAREALVAALDAVNRTAVCWSEGWRVETDHGDRLRVCHPRGPRLEVAAAHFEGPRDGGPGRIRLAPGTDRAQPGWYHARGAADHVPGPGDVRVYWHVGVAGAAPLVGAVTGALNAAGVPFRLKVLSHPGAFGRADAGVLYLPAGAWEQAWPALVRAHAEVRPYLGAAVPLATARLAPGLAWAEEPGGGESFGQHRCRLLAEGLWDAFVAREAASPAGAIAARFAAEGIDPAAPHARQASLRGGGPSPGPPSGALHAAGGSPAGEAVAPEAAARQALAREATAREAAA